MGTNFYLTKKDPDFTTEARHIGKSSMGWCFLLRLYPERGVNSLEDWIKIFNDPRYIIEDEYGAEIPTEEMISRITERSGTADFTKPIPSIYDLNSWEEFFTMNYCEKGPNNLLRHLTDHARPIVHGNGTYDMCYHEFS